MNASAEAFATILGVLVDPRTSDEELESIVYTDLQEDAARKMLVALAALHSTCIEEAAERNNASVAKTMEIMKRQFRSNMAAFRQLPDGQ